MQKYIGWEEDEIKRTVSDIYGELGLITDSLAAVALQLDKKRDNLDSDYIRKYVAVRINRIVDKLDKLNVHKLKNISLDKAIERLEEDIKREK